MKKKCKKCGHKLVEDQQCPKCDVQQTEKNDEINWSEYNDISLESVMEEMNEKHGIEPEEEPSAHHEADSGILASYIKAHKDAHKQKQAETATVVEETIEAAEEEPVAVAVATAPTNEPTEKGKNRKKWYIALAALALLGAGAWGYMYSQQAEQSAKQADAQKAKDFAQLSKDFDAFYLDDQREFIKPDKTLADFQKLERQLKDYRNEKDYAKVEATMQDVRTRLQTIDQINGFFDKPVIDGDKLAKDSHIKDGNDIQIAKLTGDKPFDKLMNEAIERGQAEHQAYRTVANKVKTLRASYTDGKLDEGVTQANYDELRKEVEKLYDSPEKEALLKDLEPINKALKARADKVATQEVQQQKQAEQQPSVPTTPTQPNNNASEASQSLSPQTPSNRDNQPIIAPRNSDLQDMNNAGWAWAPGVQEQFLSAVKSRGYVVDGGYYFEPVRIENGEGYYNLYATQASPLFNSANNFPVYVVTVNSKTGYFRGNGNDHTIR